MISCGIAMAVFDSRIIHRAIRKLRVRLRRPRPPSGPIDAGLEMRLDEQDIQQVDQEPTDAGSTASGVNPLQVPRPGESQQRASTFSSSASSSQIVKIPYSMLVGSIILGLFVIFFVAIMVLRAVLTTAPILFRFFANILLAGTIIFGIFSYSPTSTDNVIGGGWGSDRGPIVLISNRPVVIPLLSDYVVSTGFVSSRDFLIGLVLLSTIQPVIDQSGDYPSVSRS